MIDLSLETLQDALDRHTVMGVSVAEITRQDDSAGPAVATVAAGTARAGKRGMHPRAGGASPMTSSTWVQFGGLSQTVGTAFAMEFFGARGHNIDTSIARLLDESGSALVLRPAKGAPVSWVAALTLNHLYSSTSGLSLGSQRDRGCSSGGAPGAPGATIGAGGTPPVLTLLQGKHPLLGCGHPVEVAARPGASVSVAGPGFMLLQHLIEQYARVPIGAAMAKFLFKSGLAPSKCTFAASAEREPCFGVTVATGYGGGCNNRTESKDSCETAARQPVEGGRLIYPSLAAGGVGTAGSLATFLWHLGNAYRTENAVHGSGPVSHATARAMLGEGTGTGTDGGDAERVQRPGLSVARAGGRRVMLHRAANEGFRACYMVCFDAEHPPHGFVVLANGGVAAWDMIGELSKLLLGRMGFSDSGPLDLSRATPTSSRMAPASAADARAAVAAAAGQYKHGAVPNPAMAGTYSDPFHPAGYRRVTVAGDVITCTGSDAAEVGAKFRLIGRAIDADTIAIDFTPKAPHVGVLKARFDGTGLVWDAHSHGIVKGNRWLKLDGRNHKSQAPGFQPPLGHLARIIADPLLLPSPVVAKAPAPAASDRAKQAGFPFRPPPASSTGADTPTRSCPATPTAGFPLRPPSLPVPNPGGGDTKETASPFHLSLPKDAGTWARNAGNANPPIAGVSSQPALAGSRGGAAAESPSPFRLSLPKADFAAAASTTKTTTTTSKELRAPTGAGRSQRAPRLPSASPRTSPCLERKLSLGGAEKARGLSQRWPLKLSTKLPNLVSKPATWVTAMTWMAGVSTGLTERSF